MQHYDALLSIKKACGSFLGMAANAVRRRDSKAPSVNKPMDETPIHPLQLCAPRRHPGGRRAGNPELQPPVNADLCAGASPQFRIVRHYGVGLPFGIGAKIAKPDNGSSSCAATARLGSTRSSSTPRCATTLRSLVVVGLNGGWTADPQRNKPGRNLDYTRFDKMAETLGCYGEYVERPDEIRPALNRAQREVDLGSVTLVNVKTDDRARATTVTFAQYAT